MIDFFAEAMRYAKMNWPVFPCAPGDKVPAIKGGHGVKDASTNPHQLKLWAKEYPSANIGLACGEPSGGLVIIDVDPRHGGLNSITALALKGRCFPDGPRSRTGNGGQHLLFRYDGRLANSKGKLGAGIDIRSTGGYIVAPPSWLKPSESGKGGRYEWIVSPFETMIPRLPIWVSELLRPREPKPYVPPKTLEEGSTRLRGLIEFAQNAPQGQRNTSVFWAACRAAELAVDGKANPHAIRERLKIAGQMAGLSRDEIERTVDSAMKRIMGEGSS